MLTAESELAKQAVTRQISEIRSIESFIINQFGFSSFVFVGKLRRREPESYSFKKPVFLKFSMTDRECQRMNPKPSVGNKRTHSTEFGESMF